MSHFLEVNGTKVPKKFRVLGQRFEVTIVDEASLGLVDGVEGAMYEALHGIFYLHGFNQHVKGGDHAHRLLGSLASALLDFIRSNPDFVEAICDERHG